MGEPPPKAVGARRPAFSLALPRSPSGAAGTGGARGEPHETTEPKKNGQRLTRPASGNRRAQQSPGARSDPRRPQGRRAPGLEPTGPEARRGGPGGTRRDPAAAPPARTKSRQAAPPPQGRPPSAEGRDGGQAGPLTPTEREARTRGAALKPGGWAEARSWPTARTAKRGAGAPRRSGSFFGRSGRKKVETRSAHKGWPDQPPPGGPASGAHFLL